jgi:hypothetical protein
MTYDVTGEMHSFTADYTGETCWGVTEDTTGNLYIIKHGDASLNSTWMVEGKRVRVTGPAMPPFDTNVCIVIGAFATMTIDSIADASGPEPVTVGGLLAALIIIGAAAAAVGYVMYKRNPKSSKEVYQSAKASGGRSTINKLKDTIWR